MTRTEIEVVTNSIRELRRSLSPRRSMLVALTGIDGSGKGTCASEIAAALQAGEMRAAVIQVDAWLNLPDRRFDATNPAEHFYLHAIRFDEMFSQLVLPLRQRRSLRCEADYTEETASTYRKHVYEFQDVDIILLEGIFLLKRAFQDRYDLSVWIDCTFDTALQRAISRSQEGLGLEETVRAYRTIYFPAQLIHFERDRPRAAATRILMNDPKLECDERD